MAIRADNTANITLIVPIMVAVVESNMPPQPFILVVSKNNHALIERIAAKPMAKITINNSKYILLFSNPIL